METRRRSIRFGRMMLKTPEETYILLKEKAQKHGLSMANYITKCLIENEKTGIQKEIKMHITELGILLEQYLDPSFSESFEYLRIIILRCGKLHTQKRKEFIEMFNEQLKKAMDSMKAYCGDIKEV